MAEPISTSTIIGLSWGKVLINAFLAMLGGIVRLLARKDTEGNVIKPTLWNLIGGVICSMFVGIISYCVCEHFHLSSELTAALVGCSGYIGPYLIDVSFAKLQNYVDKKIGNI